MMTTSDVLAAMKQSTKFIEGKSPEDRKCSCEKCVVSLYRHTHEPDLADSRHSFWDYLRFCVASVPHPSGLWLEFGVGDGRTLEFIADQQTDQTIYGFDSFSGLPEEWKISDERIYPKHKYSRGGVAPSLRQENIEIVPGYFSESLPEFLQRHTEKCAFIHIDCDLYSSTMDVFDNLFREGRVVPGTVILFDEFYNYQYFEGNEFNAFREVFSRNGVAYKWLAHTESAFDWNGNQAALIIV